MACSILLSGAAFGQSSEARPQFEAASVKPFTSKVSDGGSRGVRPVSGPRTPDPSLFLCDSCTLADLVMSAFHIQSYQLSGPGWMESERFTVNARVPPETTPEKLRLMQQNLLGERFKLAWHHEEKELPRYELTVAKGGPTLKASEGPPTRMDGREPGATVTPDGHIHAWYSDFSMADLAAILSKQVHQPVTDATGLQGKFDFALTWVMEGMASPATEASAEHGVDSGLNIFSALQSQLGLKLEQKKGPVDRIVIDHAEKVPTGN